MLAAASSNSSGGGAGFLVIAVIAIVFVVFIRRANSKRAGVAARTQNQAVIGSEVMTGGGLYGTVVGQDDEQVLLEIAPGVQVRFAKAAIARVIEPSEPGDFEDHLHEGPADPPADPPDDAIDPPGDIRP